MASQQPTRHPLVERGRSGLIAAVRGVALGATVPASAALIAALALAVVGPFYAFFFAFVTVRGRPDSTIFIGLAAIAAVVAPALAALMLGAVRGLANLTRAAASNWAGVEIATPYQPRPEGKNRLRWMIEDPATWRDLAWLLVNTVTGLFLLLGPAIGVGVGAGSLFRMATYQSGLLAWTPPLTQAAASLLVFAAGVWLARPFLQAYGRLAATLLAPTANAELARRVSHLSQTRAESIDAGAAEIRRIERDLHDGAQARLVAMGMALDAAGALIDDDPRAARALLLEARDNSAKALGELRALVRGIHPPVLADRGLDDAIRALALDAPVRTHVTGGLDGRPAAPVESAAYFAVNELIANVAKHAGAHQVWIDIRHTDGMLRIGVTDDGRGGADPAAGTGLRGVERRLSVFDGVVAISSPPGGPTAVTMEIPCELSSAKTSSS